MRINAACVSHRKLIPDSKVCTQFYPPINSCARYAECTGRVGTPRQKTPAAYRQDRKWTGQPCDAPTEIPNQTVMLEKPHSFMRESIRARLSHEFEFPETPNLTPSTHPPV